MSDHLYKKSAAELSNLLDKGEVSSLEITQSVIDRTHEVDDRVNAFLQTNEEEALESAKAADDRRAKKGRLSPIDGIPVSLKDIIAVEGSSLTCGSKMLEHFISPYDATCTKSLKEAGAVLWGRLNMDEFAMGSSTENSAFKTTSNPWNLDHVPGGSSGGSAACVAAGETILSLGSDTGGSVRQPASFCGVVGINPTYGSISRYGLVAFASSLDQIGPMGKTVEDVAHLLQCLVKHDPLDSTSVKTEPQDFVNSLKADDKKWKIGLPKEYFGEGLSEEVKTSAEKAVKFYESKGCEIIDVSLPHTEYAVPAYYIIATAEASSNLSRYDGIRYTHRSPNAKNAVDIYFKSRGEGFGDEVKRRILLGSYVLSSGYYDAYYLKAQKIRSLIRQDFTNALEKVDAVITPTSPTPAFKKGEKSKDLMSMYLSDIYTISLNLTGLPGISVPSGHTNNNLPLGIQLIGKPYQEGELLQIANLFDKEHLYGKLIPEIK